jgi:hypothetical protein
MAMAIAMAIVTPMAVMSHKAIFTVRYCLFSIFVLLIQIYENSVLGVKIGEKIGVFGVV